MVTGQLLNETVFNGISDAQGNDSFEALRKTDVLDVPLVSGAFNLNLGFIASTAEVENNLQFLG